MKTVVNKVLTPAVFTSVLLFGASNSFAYTVKKGDTLSEIAENHGLSLNEIIAINPQIKNPDLIYVGETVHTTGNKTKVSTNINTNNKVNITPQEKELLARLVEAEAKGESYAGKVAVANVVLNRVEHHDFPDTVSSVIYQDGQFSPVASGSINQPASIESKRAVEEAFNKDVSNGALYFYNPKTASSNWLDNRPTTTVIGNHVFKK
jgi:N-acetylmuramoyl-L-alanine amidase